MKKNYRTLLAVLALVLVLLATTVMTACGGAADTPTTPTTPTTPEPTEPAATTEPVAADEFAVILEAVQGWVACSSGWYTKAPDLFLALNDDDEGNDPKVISIRGADVYALGHVPGAVNMGFTDLLADGAMSADGKTVIVCYTGQSASQATAVMGVLGYDAATLLHGMTSWTTDAALAPKAFDPAVAQNDYATATEATTAAGGNDLPVIENTDSADTDAILMAAAAAYAQPKFIGANDVFMMINDDDADNDPFIISVRAPADYATAHVPGAVNLPVAALFTEDGLSQIPADKQVVVYCYTGHSAAQATAMLNLLGYDAYSMKYGFCSWSPASIKCFSDAARSDYATEK